VDYTLDLVIIGLTALAIQALFGAPRFVVDVLELRKRWKGWKAERPPSTMAQLAAHIDMRELEPKRRAATRKLILVRVYMGVSGTAGLAVCAALAFSGHLSTFVVLFLGFDLWTCAGAGLGIYLVHRAGSLWLLAELRERARTEPGLTPELSQLLGEN